jgi:hypothetical protein
MGINLLVELELNRPNWDHIVESDGPATKIPGAIRELLAAATPEQAELAYWKLENHVVVQGQLFEAACFVVPIIMTALLQEERPRFIQISLLELLFQIVHGESHCEETARGLANLRDRCRAAAREGLWILYHAFINRNLVGAKEVIELIDKDTARLVILERMRQNCAQEGGAD